MSKINKLNYGGRTSRLPVRFQEVEYLQSSGTNITYIDTSIVPQANTKIDIDYRMVNFEAPVAYIGRWHSIYGADTNYALTINGITQQYSYQYGTWNDASHTVDLLKHNIVQDGNKFYEDGSLIYTSSNTWTTTFNKILLFARKSTNGGYLEIYKCKIWQDGETLVRDFVPCYCKLAHNVNLAGMYDLASPIDANVNLFPNPNWHPNSSTGYWETDLCDISQSSRTYVYMETSTPEYILYNSNMDIIRTGYLNDGYSYINTADASYIRLGDMLTDPSSKELGIYNFSAFYVNSSGTGNTFIVGPDVNIAPIPYIGNTEADYVFVGEEMVYGEPNSTVGYAVTDNSTIGV